VERPRTCSAFYLYNFHANLRWFLDSTLRLCTVLGYGSLFSLADSTRVFLTPSAPKAREKFGGLDYGGGLSPPPPSSEEENTRVPMLCSVHRARQRVESEVWFAQSETVSDFSSERPGEVRVWALRPQVWGWGCFCARLRTVVMNDCFRYGRAGIRPRGPLVARSKPPATIPGNRQPLEGSDRRRE
jgi:hypothetical protein